MKVLICGSRKFLSEKRVRNHLDLTFTGRETILHGGAPGVDSFANVWAVDSHIPVEVFRPVDPTIKTHYLYRNVEMITLCDKVIAFWDKESSGTKFVIDYARARGKPVEVIYETN